MSQYMSMKVKEFRIRDSDVGEEIDDGVQDKLAAGIGNHQIEVIFGTFSHGRTFST